MIQNGAFAGSRPVPNHKDFTIANKQFQSNIQLAGRPYLRSLKLPAFLAALSVIFLFCSLERPLRAAFVSLARRSNGVWLFFSHFSLASDLRFSLITVRCLAMAFLTTLMRANLTWGAEETFWVRRPTSSSFSLLRPSKRDGSSDFLSWY